MENSLHQIQAAGIQAMESAASLRDLDSVRVRFLGKNGEVTAILKQMGKLPPDQRPVMGQLANEVRAALEDAFQARLSVLKQEELQKQLESETLDVTLPGTASPIGSRHPLQIVLEDLKNIFRGMGYTVVDGPEVEETKSVFDMLNTLDGHPAREEQDTFYITDDLVLRTQTSSVQIRTMLEQKPPIAVISPGRVYRRDNVDATHSYFPPM